MSGDELPLVHQAFDDNYVAPLGPHVDAFERELAAYVGVGHCAALSSGTAGLHLALRLLGIEPGEEVIASSLTFSATVNPVCYERAHPVFIDSERQTWNMDPELLAEELEACARRGRLPRAVIAVDLYGQAAQLDPILEACARYDVPLIEDAAEALGADYRGRKCGSFGRLSVLSFNGNKIITTSGGGALLSDNPTLIERARYLATQAREPAPHYEHVTVGFNYRLSNVSAAIGRGQLRHIDERVAQRRANFAAYHAALADLPGLEFMPEAPTGRSNRWLTCLTLDPALFGGTRETVRLALAEADIESRPVWKPMHLQPVFAGARTRGGAVAADLFDRGLCLPSGSNLAPADRDRVIEIVRRCHRA
jgi:pyridoxal phosphate-dependent aminotransferase EpsN